MGSTSLGEELQKTANAKLPGTLVKCMVQIISGLIHLEIIKNFIFHFTFWFLRFLTYFLIFFNRPITDGADVL
jgi:hypothetical protein